MHAQILICGTDPTLLSTRRDVLRGVGFDVSTASHQEEIEALIQALTVDALVICHTFEPEQQHETLALLHRYRPSAKSIILTKNATREVSGEPDAFVSTVEGPKTLVQTLGRLLNHGRIADSEQGNTPVHCDHHERSAPKALDRGR